MRYLIPIIPLLLLTLFPIIAADKRC
jgi:hypothetical protein